MTTNNRNYIQWLHEWARLSFDTIRVQDGFQGGQWPNALLFVLLKHALELGYYDAGIRVLDDAQLLGDEQKAQLRTEPHFFQVQQASVATPTPAAAAAGPAVNASRYELLYSAVSRGHGRCASLLAEFLTPRIGDLFGTRYLIEQLRALEKLSLDAHRSSRAPDGRAPRLLHLSARRVDDRARELPARVDALCTPAGRRRRRGGRRRIARASTWARTAGSRTCGPQNKTLTPVQLEGELDEIFNKQQPPGRVPLPPIVRDNQNQGYIHAPSVNHAVTAAVLRNGYVANATPAQPDLLKVNLSSERVRRALGIIEGIRSGQSLAALLGYEFERGLHDRYADRGVRPLHLSAAPGVPARHDAPEDLPEGTSDPVHRGAQRRQRPEAAAPRARTPAPANRDLSLRLPEYQTARRLERRAAMPSTPKSTGCSTSTTRSRTSPSPRACTRSSWATTIARRRRSMPTARRRSRRFRMSCRRRAAASC